MIIISVFTLIFLLLVGAVITIIGTRVISAAHSPAGRFVHVSGGKLHVVELGSAQIDEPAILLIHGASGNLEDMRALGELLARRARVVLVDRPGQGWSDRPGGAHDASPVRQARLIVEALDALRISRAIIVGHSLGGTVAAALALTQPERASGLVLLSAVTHPWLGGVAWYYVIGSTQWVGKLFARTLALPLGLLMLRRGITSVFAPDKVPPGYARRVGVAMFLRPAQFVANAADVSALYPFVAEHMPQYGRLRMPVGILSGDADSVVSADVHSCALATAIRDCRLIILPGGGHMPHHAAPASVVDLIEEVARAAQLHETGEQVQRIRHAAARVIGASPF